jgi:hypothetical protein
MGRPIPQPLGDHCGGLPETGKRSRPIRLGERVALSVDPRTRDRPDGRCSSYALHRACAVQYRRRISWRIDWHRSNHPNCSSAQSSSGCDL